MIERLQCVGSDRWEKAMPTRLLMPAERLGPLGHRKSGCVLFPVEQCMSPCLATRRWYVAEPRDSVVRVLFERLPTARRGTESSHA